MSSGRLTPPTHAARGTVRSTKINASNFNKLEVVWRFNTDNIGNRPEYKLEGTPLMVHGVLYATAGSRRGGHGAGRGGELLWVHASLTGRTARRSASSIRHLRTA